MLRIPNAWSGFVRGVGFTAAVALLLAAAPTSRAEAMTLVSPAASPAAKVASDGMITEVRHGGGGFHGGVHFGGGHFGGRHFGGGHFGGGHFGGFRGGGFHARHIGGYRYGGYRFGGHRFVGHPYWRRHHRFYGGVYYHPHRRCRIIWTYYGPHRICHWRHWGWPYPYW